MTPPLGPTPVTSLIPKGVTGALGVSWKQVIQQFPFGDAIWTTLEAHGALVAVAAAALLLVVGRLRSGVSTGDSSEQEIRDATLSSMLAEERRQTADAGGESSELGEELGPEATGAGTGETFADLSESHQNLLAASAIESDTRQPTVDEELTKTLHIQGAPDAPKDGFLSPLFELTDARFDLTAYVTTRHQGRSREELKDRADDLTVDAEDADSSTGRHLAREAKKAEEIHAAAESGTRVFDLSMWVTVRGETAEELEANERKVRKALRDDPANLVPKPAIAKQEAALQSAAPLGPDELGDTDRKYYKLPTMAGGVGALLASPTNPTLTESTGVEVGKHKSTQTPVIIDPCERENGHAWFLLADPGGGKSYTGKLVVNRLTTQRDDVRSVILEPLGNWQGVAEALDAEHVVIGGDTGINPLEIKPLEGSRRRNLHAGANPLAEKREDAIGFFKNFFAMRGLEDEFAKRRATFEAALDDAYEAAGITEDIATHSRDSPTVQDELFGALRGRENAPHNYTESDRRETKVSEDASWLLRNLKPFSENGQYSNLGGESTIDLRNSETVYLDLGQSEGHISEKAKLTMQLLVTEVYETAKQTDDWLVFAMDEFRYILQDAVNLGFMETLFRHHRHHQIIPMLMTQTVDEFLAKDEAEMILDQCTIKQFLSLDAMDEELASEFDLNKAQERFVASEAEAGSADLGYADSLLGVDGDWRRVEIHALPGEDKVIDADPTGATSRDGIQQNTTTSTSSSRATTDGGRGRQRNTTRGDGRE